MRPPKREYNFEYEKVAVDDFISGIIEDINYDQEHLFKGFGRDESGNPRPDRKAPAVRFKFKLQGYEHPHYSKWLSFSYGEKSNLYQKYLVPLVQNAKPDMDFDLDQLKGMKIKTLWVEKNNFQSVETIRPIGKKVFPMTVAKGDLADVAENEDDEEVPF